jgi:hypothetical protein
MRERPLVNAHQRATANAEKGPVNALQLNAQNSSIRKA